MSFTFPSIRLKVIRSTCGSHSNEILLFAPAPRAIFLRIKSVQIVLRAAVPEICFLIMLMSDDVEVDELI